MRLILLPDPDGAFHQEKAYDLYEVAELTGLHYDTVRRRIAARAWPYVMYGRRIYLTEAMVWQVAEASAHVYPAHEPGGS